MGYDIYSLNQTGKYSETWSFEDYNLMLKCGDAAHFNIFVWPMVLNLAESYGWQPAGTLPGPEYYDEEGNRLPQDWSGSYYHNDGAVVTAEDAAALGAALESALDDIPDLPTPKPLMVDQSLIKGGSSSSSIGDLFMEYMGDKEISLTRTNTDLHPFEYFSGEMKQILISFIALCKKGEFTIW